MEAPKFWKKAVFWIAFSLAAGVLSSWLTRDGLERFEQIAKPALTPPRIVFPIAWTILLFLIGFGFALIREKTMGTASADSAVNHGPTFLPPRKYSDAEEFERFA